MNNSIFRSMMRITMIVLYYHQRKKLHAVQSWMKGKAPGLWMDWWTEALRYSTADLLGIFDFQLVLFFFSNEYFLIIIYIKYVPNRLLCWMIFYALVYFSLEVMSCSPLTRPRRILYSPHWIKTLIIKSRCHSAPARCRHKRPFACFLVMFFVVRITSAGALPPLCAARPIIISHSLGIDQRAGESHLWGREGAVLLTSARSKERLSLEQDTREKCSDDEKCCSSVICVCGVGGVYLSVFSFHYTTPSYIIRDSHNGIKSELREFSSIPSFFFFCKFRKGSVQ